MLISLLAHWPNQPSLQSIAGGVMLSALVAVFFGYYPARKEVRLTPIVAPCNE
jgi:ABC-type antimicrobial peptide transport system permease subunit